MMSSLRSSGSCCRCISFRSGYFLRLSAWLTIASFFAYGVFMGVSLPIPTTGLTVLPLFRLLSSTSGSILSRASTLFLKLKLLYLVTLLDVFLWFLSFTGCLTAAPFLFDGLGVFYSLSFSSDCSLSDKRMPIVCIALSTFLLPRPTLT